VADRFHLVKNLGEVLEQVFCGYRPELKAVEQKHRQALAPAQTVVVIAKPTATIKTQERFQVTQQNRIEQQQEIKKLNEQGWTQIAIAQKVGLSERTVRRWLTQDTREHWLFAPLVLPSPIINRSASTISSL